jgi:nucleoside triphosphate diphosphatase
MDGSQSEIDELLNVMKRLRNPVGGCPWDAQQSFSTIAPFTIEEAYEVADAIDRDDMCDLRDELGDLLLQVVFLSRIAEERGAFSFHDVVTSIVGKLVRRHPHVFGSEIVSDAKAQTAEWERHKKRERESKGGSDTSALAGISLGMPEWIRATKIQKRAAQVGFDWPRPGQVLDKLLEEVEEVRAEFVELERLPQDDLVRVRLEEEVGDVLFVCANLARHADVDVGNALRRANLKFERRFRKMEELARVDGVELTDLSQGEQEEYWVKVKRGE